MNPPAVEGRPVGWAVIRNGERIIRLYIKPSAAKAQATHLTNQRYGQHTILPLYLGKEPTQ